MLLVRVDLAGEPDQSPESSRRAIAVASGAHHGMCLALPYALEIAGICCFGKT